VLELNNKGRLINLDSNISWESQPVTLSLIELSTVYDPAMRSFSSAPQTFSMTHYLSRSAFGDIAKVATLLKRANVLIRMDRHSSCIRAIQDP
jgi:hypothetical protein